MQSLPRFNHLESWKNHHLVIFGLAREGLSSYRFLRAQLPTTQIWLIDEKPLVELGTEIAQLTQDEQTHFVQSVAELDADQELVLVKSAGIPPSHPLVEELVSKGVPVVTNAQLCLASLAELAGTVEQELVTIGVTGTKGKSTTTTLLHHVLVETDHEAYLGGNIGSPALEMLTAWAEQTTHQETAYFAFELSSAQLSDITLSPHIAVIQHIIPEHLDYHADFAEYLAAKTTIVRHQTKDDLVFYNADSETARQVADQSAGQQLGYSQTDPQAQCHVADDALVSDQVQLPLAAIPLAGAHNRYNVMPAVLLAAELGISSAALEAAVRSFSPLPHRLQLVAEVAGVRYYDDSIATNPTASIAALQAFAEEPVVLLGGGFDRGQDYAPLAEELTKHTTRGLAVFPPTGDRLLAAAQQAGATYQTLEAKSMVEAVQFAHGLLKDAGGVVLLSPGAASFGMFKDYRDRGDQFARAAQKLLNK